MQASIPTSWVSTVPATLTGRFMILAFLIALQTQLVSSVSAEVTFLNKWGGYGSGDAVRRDHVLFRLRLANELTHQLEPAVSL